MSEQPTQEQPGQEPAEQPDQSQALEARLAKLETEAEEQKKYASKLEQENSTYRQIISDRGQAPAQQPQVQVSELDREIEQLERQAQAGEISAEELSMRSLGLIRKAKEEGKQEAVTSLTNRYTQEQEINRQFSSIFEDPELKGLEKDLGDIAFGYLQAAISQGQSLQQAAMYAKEQTKVKFNSFKQRFGQPANPTPPSVETPPANPLKGENEAPPSTPPKEEPVTAEASQTSFIEARRAKMMR